MDWVDDDVNSIEEISHGPFSKEQLLWAFDRSDIDLGRHGPKYPRNSTRKDRRKIGQKWREDMGGHQ